MNNLLETVLGTLFFAWIISKFVPGGWTGGDDDDDDDDDTPAPGGVPFEFQAVPPGEAAAFGLANPDYQPLAELSRALLAGGAATAPQGIALMQQGRVFMADHPGQACFVRIKLD